jgi:hypothetical protein
MISRDIWYSIAIRADDRDILDMLGVNKKFNEPEFFQTVFRNKYPLLQKFKREEESWREFYLSMIKYIYKLQEEYSFEYVPAQSLNPKFLYCHFKDREHFDKENISWKHLEFCGETGDMKYFCKYLTEELSSEDEMSILSGVCLSGNFLLFEECYKKFDEVHLTVEDFENALVSGNVDLINIVRKQLVLSKKIEMEHIMFAAIRRHDYETFLSCFPDVLEIRAKPRMPRYYIGTRMGTVSVENNNLKTIKYLVKEKVTMEIQSVTTHCMIYDRKEILEYLVKEKVDEIKHVEELIEIAEKYDNKHLIVFLAKNWPKYHMYDSSPILIEKMIEMNKVDDEFRNIVAERMYFGAPAHIEEFLKRFPNLVSQKLLQIVSDLSNQYSKFETANVTQKLASYLK